MSPYSYDDYRAYLRDWFWTSKQRNPRLSFRSVSRRLGLRAPNHFHLVITEKRHLSKALFTKALQMLKVGSREQHFLKLLHAHSHGRTPDELADLEKQISALRKAAGRENLGTEQYKLVAHTLAWHMRMASQQFDGVTLEELAQRVKTYSVFPVGDDQINEAVQLLVQLGILKVDEQSVCHFDSDDITTRWNFESDAVKAHHAGNLRLALETIPWPMDRRFFTSVTVPCGGALREEIVGDLRALCMKILEASKGQDEENAPPGQLVTLEIAMFPFFDFARGGAAAQRAPTPEVRPSNSSR